MPRMAELERDETAASIDPAVRAGGIEGGGKVIAINVSVVNTDPTLLVITTEVEEYTSSGEASDASPAGVVRSIGSTGLVVDVAEVDSALCEVSVGPV
jgi:hypothetical protein